MAFSSHSISELGHGSVKQLLFEECLASEQPSHPLVVPEESFAEFLAWHTVLEHSGHFAQNEE